MYEKYKKMVYKTEKSNFFLFYYLLYMHYDTDFERVLVFLSEVFFATCSNQYKAGACIYYG